VAGETPGVNAVPDGHSANLIRFPFGSAFFCSHLPLPTKITAQVLEPIDMPPQFGDDPDIDEVDAYVRSVMQTALDVLANKRRFPVLGYRRMPESAATCVLQMISRLS